MEAPSCMVLVVDDDVDFLQATAGLLREHDYGCDTARDAAEAKEMLGVRSYDVVVADLRMEGNEDLEFVGSLAASHKQLGAILVTGYPSVETAVRALDLNLAAYLVKPFDFDELRSRIDSVVRHARESASIEISRSEIAAARNALDRAGQLLAGTRVEDAAADVNEPAVFREDTRESEHPALSWLTRRERELVGLLLEGYRVSTIAETLYISPHTVRRHLKSIFLKLEVNSQAELLEKLKPPRRAGGVPPRTKP